MERHSIAGSVRLGMARQRKVSQAVFGEARHGVEWNRRAG